MGSYLPGTAVTVGRDLLSFLLLAWQHIATV